MKKLLFTQRVEIVGSYNERRDCSDQNIARFVQACGYLPLPICNTPDYIDEYLEILKPDGFLLTGGNDLMQYGGNAPERDKLEYLLVEKALQNNIPLLGFCRGMQIIAVYFGAKLMRVSNHVSTRHVLTGSFDRAVNSYHNYGIYELPETLESLAQSTDGVIEALRHREKAIAGIMWHPEREAPFQLPDIELVKEFFK